MKFLLQKVNGRTVHDFTFLLEQSKDYVNWYGSIMGETIEITYLDTDTDGNIVGCVNGNEFPLINNPEKFIPVGEVGFVSRFLRQFYPAATECLRPLNVPEQLFPFAGRKIANIRTAGDLARFVALFPEGGADGIELYCKSNEVIKKPANGPVYCSLNDSDFIGRQVSEMVGMVSEWRVFVFRGEILYVANYCGDSLVFPSPKRIRDMVAAYDMWSPVAYTLDVAVLENGETVVVECHRFFSCGLYGFADLAKYPKMLSQAWYQIKNQR